jgi:DNA end-binding protein Ku
MRSIWSGNISFALVNIPVRLYPATKAQDLPLHLLRRGDHCPISYARVCREDGKEVPWKDVVHGYEYKKGEYVVLDEEDFSLANPRKTQTIEVLCFADESEVPTKYFDKPYYVGPGKTNSKRPFVLLRDALKHAEKVGIARYVLRTREYIGMLKAEGNLLLLNQLRYKSEIMPPKDIECPKTAEVSRKEIDTAMELIDSLTEPFKPEQFKDTYHEDLMRIIEEKIRGRHPRLKAEDEEVEPTPVNDLMARLQESLDRRQAHHSSRANGR